MNTRWSPGTNSTAARRTTPASNAMTVYKLLKMPILKRLRWLRQVNPWNKRANVKVENPIVAATALEPVTFPATFPATFPTIHSGHPYNPAKYAVMVQTAMRNPWIVISFRKVPVRIPRFVSLGGLFKSPSSGGSMPIARAGRESVTRFIKSRWTGANGVGRFLMVVYSTHKMPAILPDIKN